MGDHGSWSVSLGRWGGLHVRLHMFFLLFAAFTLYLSWREQKALVHFIVVSLVILLASVLLHELGHYLATVRLGGWARQLVLGPLGGLVPVKAPRHPRSELVVHLAGPLVNLAICVICAALLYGQDGFGWIGLLHPLRPQHLGGEVGDTVTPLTLTKLTFWINWVLLLVNLLPAYPFDGGRVLRAAIQQFRPKLALGEVVAWVAWLAKLAAAGLLVGAVLAFHREESAGSPDGLLPTWFALVLLALCVFFSAKQEEQRHLSVEQVGRAGIDLSQDIDQALDRRLEEDEEEGWIEDPLEARIRRAQEQAEAEEDRRVDEILLRLHQYGMPSLSADDRRLLERVSARYRSRQRHKA